MGIGSIQIGKLVTQSEDPIWQLSSSVTLKETRISGCNLLKKFLTGFKSECLKDSREIDVLKGTIEKALSVYENARKFSKEELTEQRQRALDGYSIYLSKVAKMVDCKARVSRFIEFCLIPEKRIWGSLSPQDEEFIKEVSITDAVLKQLVLELKLEQGWLNSSATKSAQKFTENISQGILTFCQLVDKALTPGLVPVEIMADPSPIGDSLDHAKNYFGKWEGIYTAIFTKLSNVYKEQFTKSNNVKRLVDQLKGCVADLDHILQQKIVVDFSEEDLKTQHNAIKAMVRYAINETAKLGEFAQMLQKGAEFLKEGPIDPFLTAFQPHFPQFLAERAKLENSLKENYQEISEYARRILITYNAILKDFHGEGYEPGSLFRSLHRFQKIREKGGDPLTLVQRAITFGKGFLGSWGGVPPVYSNPYWTTSIPIEEEKPGDEEEGVASA